MPHLISTRRYSFIGVGLSLISRYLLPSSKTAYFEWLMCHLRFGNGPCTYEELSIYYCCSQGCMPTLVISFFNSLRGHQARWARETSQRQRCILWMVRVPLWFLLREVESRKRWEGRWPKEGDADDWARSEQQGKCKTGLDSRQSYQCCTLLCVYLDDDVVYMPCIKKAIVHLSDSGHHCLSIDISQNHFTISAPSISVTVTGKLHLVIRKHILMFPRENQTLHSYSTENSVTLSHSYSCLVRSAASVHMYVSAVDIEFVSLKQKEHTLLNKKNNQVNSADRGERRSWTRQ